WRAHLLSRLRRQIEITGNPVLEELMKEALGYKYADAPESLPGGHDLANAVLVPLKIHTSLGLLSFFSTTTVFGTPVDVTLSELAIEMFFPADAATAAAVRRAGGR
ncbi:MAG TPA: transcriptional regulator, partial [Burkholderiales bacterium]|nr:transcriptional regulator [Burkholderiales bacterium]